jgi:adenosine deaminase
MCRQSWAPATKSRPRRPSALRRAGVVERLEDHPYPRMRAAGLLATVNTDDPGLSDLDLGKEYAAVAAAFGYAWDDMVQIALDGVEACWLDEPGRRRLAGRVRTAAARLAAADAGVTAPAPPGRGLV